MLWNSPYLLLLIATFFWGGNFVFGSVLVHELPPFTLALMRWSVAFAVLILLFGKEMAESIRLLLVHWKKLFFLTLTGIFGFNTLVYIAVEYTSPINSSLMNSATPIVILLLSLFFLGEKATLYRVAGILVSLAGVVWIIARGSMETLLRLNFNQGDLWMFLAVIVWALYSIGMKKYAHLFPGNVLFTAKVTLSLFLLAPVSLVELSVLDHDVAFKPVVVAGILYIGLCASIVSFTCWNRAVSLIGPSRCGSFLNLIPLFSTVLSIVFLDERVHLYHFLGAALILFGVYVTTWTKNEAIRNFFRFHFVKLFIRKGRRTYHSSRGE